MMIIRRSQMSGMKRVKDERYRTILSDIELFSGFMALFYRLNVLT